MSSIHHWALSGRPLAVELGVDSREGVSFSWSGMKLVVDLEIDTRRENGENGENGEVVAGTSVAEHAIRQSKDSEDATNEPGSTQRSGTLQHDTDAIEGPLVNPQNDKKDCDEQQPSKEEGKCGAGPETQDRNWTHSTWPDWGDPLPPEEDDDLDVVDFAAGEEKTYGSKKVVTFSDVVTFVEPSSLQEERETGSFSYLGSSDDELEQGTDQVTSSSDGNCSDLSSIPVSPSSEKENLNSADVSAACHLLELGNESNCGVSKEKGFISSGVSGRRKCEFYDPSHDLERLSELVEKIYAALPQLSSVSRSQGSVSSQGLGYWTIEVSKDSGRFRMKRIKREDAECKGLLGVHDLDDENEVLERPPWKRHYKSLSNF